MCIADGKIIDFAPAAARVSRNSLTACCQPIPVSAHKHLFFEGDLRNHVYIIESGWVKLYRTLVDGQRQIVEFANAGAILGFESELEHCNSCEAITDVSMRAIPIRRLPDMLQSDPTLAKSMLEQMGRQLGAAQSQLAVIGVQSAEQKLATFLLSMANLSGVDECGELDLPMRRGEMAEFLGLRLETVSRKMSEFQKRGWIQLVTIYRCRICARGVLEHLSEGGANLDKRSIA